MDEPPVATEHRSAEPPRSAPAARRRLRHIGLSVWPLLIAFWALGLLWLAMSSLACWGGHLGPGWHLACDWVFALPLLPGLLAVAAFVLGLIELRHAGRALGRPAHSWRDHIRLGYRGAADDDRARVRRALFGTLSVAGWTLAALAFSYLQLMLWAVFIGVAVMAAVLLVNRHLLQDMARPRYRYGVQVPPHERGPVAW